MEIGLREWLILIGVIVFIVILLDSLRRMRGGRNKVKLDIDPSLIPEDDNERTEQLGPVRVLSAKEREPNATMQSRPVRHTAPNRQQPRIEDEDEIPSIVPERDEDSIEEPKTPEPQMETSTPSQQDSSTSNEVLVISVQSKDPNGFSGPALLQNILESGLRFGHMSIFHRHESMTGNGEIQFSMVNAVEPGTFDLDDIDHFRTPVVSFFLRLPGPRHPKQAFDLMLAAARKLSQELGGDLKDDQRSVLTNQTIENYYRQRITEFERRQITQIHRR